MVPKILLGVGIFAALLSILIFSGKIPGFDGGAVVPRGDVILWGTLPEVAMNNAIQEFNTQAKTYAVRYKYVSENGFNQKLLEALASGAGPDMIIAPYQTILSQEGRLQRFLIAEKTYKDIYVDGASVLYDIQLAGAVALPVSIDPMVLFYNRTLFSKHGIVNPPTYWNEVVDIVPTLTIKESGHFVESGIALGTPAVSYSKDILMAFIAQIGQIPVVKVPTNQGRSIISVIANDPVNSDSKVLPLATAARFITQFGDPGQSTYSWSQTQVGDTSDVFVSEKLAMYIGYAGEFSTLRERNPRADIAMTFLPQIKDNNTFAMGMRMYALGTLTSSRNPQAALKVEAEFAGAGVSPTIAAITGSVPALRGYAGTQGLDPVVARSMLVARGWYDTSSAESTAYVGAMISDIINYRQGVNDAAAVFVSRLRDLYTKD